MLELDSGSSRSGSHSNGGEGEGRGVQLSYPRCGWSDLAVAPALALALAAHRAVAPGGALASVGGAGAGNASELSRDSYGDERDTEGRGGV